MSIARTAKEHWEWTQKRRERFADQDCQCPLCQLMPEHLALLDRIAELETATERVRDYHKPVAHNFMPKSCRCGALLPCPTLQALEGDQP